MPAQEGEKTDEVLNFLSMFDPIKTYAKNEIPEIFKDIADSYYADAIVVRDKAAEKHEADPTKPTGEEAFEKKMADLRSDVENIAEIVGTQSGTHLLKFRTPEFNKNNADQDIATSVLRLSRAGKNKGSKFLPSMDARKSKLAKIIYRPIQVEGHDRVACLVDHILEADELSPDILASFADVFGSHVLEALCNELMSGNTYTTGLPDTGFPSVFIPTPNGDIQITPIPPAESHKNILDVRRERLVENHEKKKEKGLDQEARRKLDQENWKIVSSFCSQTLTSQMQNILPGADARRMRFFAQFPSVMSNHSAQCYRFAKGGRQPDIYDLDLAERVQSFITLFETWRKHHSPEISASLDRLAKACHRIASEHAEDILKISREFEPDMSGKVDLASLCLSAYRNEYRPNDTDLTAAKKYLADKKFQKQMEKVS